MSWIIPNIFPTLNANETHLWKARIADLSQWMQPTDWSASEGFASESMAPAVRERSLASLWLTRTLLGRYLATDSSQLEFSTTPQGKPQLHRPPACIAFNRSHSGDWCLLAVAAQGKIGVDVEHIRPRQQRDGIVERWYLPEEKNAWRNLPEEEKNAWFFQRWTEKEAVLKCFGVGLTKISDFASLRCQVKISPFEVALDYPGCVASTCTGPVLFFDFTG